MEKKKEHIIKPVYAIPCLNEIGEYFFIKFNTDNEKQALTLATCVQGKRGKKSLVILTEQGDIYNL
jgi:hypothetical protein